MMRWPVRLFIAGLCCAVLGQPFCYAAGGHSEDKEDKLAAKIAEEKHPGKKARLQIRLARVNLLEAINAYNHKDFEAGKSLLAKYLAQVNQSWKTLQESGWQAAKHPQAFKDLDITLREDERLLEDLRHRVPYFESEPIIQVQKDRGAVRRQVLDALFPASRPKNKPPKPARLTGTLAAKRLVDA